MNTSYFAIVLYIAKFMLQLSTERRTVYVFQLILPRDAIAMHSRGNSVRPSICLSHSRIRAKIAKLSVFSDFAIC